MNWNQLLSGKRFGMEEYHERKHERTDFQRRSEERRVRERV